MKHRIECPVGETAACEIIRAALERYAQRYQRFEPELSWSDAGHASFAFVVAGARVQGELVVAEGYIDVEVEAPWLLRIFRAEAVRRIDAEAEHLFSQAAAGAAPR
jgi:hypothetical protein